MMFWKALIAYMCAVTLIACSEESRTTDFEFTHGPHRLSGTVYLPDEGEGPYPLIILVHGDGAMPRDAYGYYRPFIQTLNEVGYAVASWDKPGVELSMGYWLNQSMSDRADEISHAVDSLEAFENLNTQTLGVMGFSQAGWVMPEAIAQDDRLDFMIAASPAINWMEQSHYASQHRLEQAGLSAEELSEAFTHIQVIDELIAERASYRAYQIAMSQAPDCCDDLMSPARWRFVLTNFQSDARAQLQQLDVPVLALLGGHDLNVDTRQTEREYQLHLGETAPLTIVFAPHADHSLLQAPHPRYVTADSAMVRRLVMIDLRGQSVFAEDVFPTLKTWSEARLKDAG